MKELHQFQRVKIVDENNIPLPPVLDHNVLSYLSRRENGEWKCFYTQEGKLYELIWGDNMVYHMLEMLRRPFIIYTFIYMLMMKLKNYNTLIIINILLLYY